MKYNHVQLDIKTYINSLYKDGLKKSDILSKKELENTILNIGIFKVKGYIKAFRNKLSEYTIDDLLELYRIDRQLSLNMLSLTSQIEIKLKSFLIETVYSLTDNPFFYLLKDNYKEDYNLPIDSLYDWEVKEYSIKQKNEIYPHYRDYYLKHYDFKSNTTEYLNSKLLIYLDEERDINYPPFHYFIESASLGTLINIISKLNIGNNDILKLIARKFHFYQENVFLTSLLRLKELRNRCAHNGRIFNRNFRGLRAFGLHKIFRTTIYEHKLIDVYFTLHFLLDNTDKFNNIEKLISSFETDNLSECSDNMKSFVISIMKTR
ncbi:MAG: hypothetical protein DRG78_01265 [Epsilonproteobacteria bacterium]|nr:MAG: hypothetical protein DRG78_01265 [Campylobacterota bacterium]